MLIGYEADETLEFESTSERQERVIELHNTNGSYKNYNC